VGELTATVEEAEGILPLRTRFAATGPYCLLRWNGQRLEAVDRPPAGEEVALPHVAGPMGL